MTSNLTVIHHHAIISCLEFCVRLGNAMLANHWDFGKKQQFKVQGLNKLKWKEARVLPLDVDLPKRTLMKEIYSTQTLASTEKMQKIGES